LLVLVRTLNFVTTATCAVYVVFFGCYCTFLASIIMQSAKKKSCGEVKRLRPSLDKFSNSA